MAIGGIGIADVLEYDIESGSLARDDFTRGGDTTGDYDEAAIGDDNFNSLEIGFVVLSPYGELIFSDFKIGGQSKNGGARAVGIGCGDEVKGYGVD